MRSPLSRPEHDDCGTSQTSIRHHPWPRSAMKEYAVAPIHTGGVAMRHVGPRGAPPEVEQRENQYPLFHVIRATETSFIVSRRGEFASKRFMHRSSRPPRFTP